MTAIDISRPPPICCEWQLIAESQDIRLRRYREALEAIMDRCAELATIETSALVDSVTGISQCAIEEKSPLPDTAKPIITSDELRAWRKLFRWTQRDAARALMIGYGTYRGYERGATIPPHIALLCEFIRRHGPIEVES
jgi:DNA-binding transcriptional regulator YiaG